MITASGGATYTYDGLNERAGDDRQHQSYRNHLLRRRWQLLCLIPSSGAWTDLIYAGTSMIAGSGRHANGSANLPACGSFRIAGSADEQFRYRNGIECVSALRRLAVVHHYRRVPVHRLAAGHGEFEHPCHVSDPIHDAESPVAPRSLQWQRRHHQSPELQPLRLCDEQSAGAARPLWFGR